MMRDGVCFIRKTGDSSLLSDSRLPNYKAGKTNRKAEQGYCACSNVLHGSYVCEKAIRRHVFRSYRYRWGGCRKINGAYFFRIRHSGSARSERFTSATSAGQRERGLIRTDASVLRQPNGAEREVVALFESFRSAHGMIRSIDGRMSRARISVTMFRQKDDRVLLFKRHLCAVLHFNFDNTCKLYIFTFLYKSAYFVRK